MTLLVLLMVGICRSAIWLGPDGTWHSLWWVHLTILLTYVFTALAPSWRSFDARLALTELTLRRSRLGFHWPKLGSLHPSLVRAVQPEARADA